MCTPTLLLALGLLASPSQVMVKVAPQTELTLRQVQQSQLRGQIQQAAAALDQSKALVGTLAPMRFSTAPPIAWAGQDPADSLYRAARYALNRSDYWRSVELFRAVRNRYPKSAYAPDSYYWESYSLFRRGSIDALRMALETLAQQRRLFPRATTRTAGDARSLETRIRSELARSGDAVAAQAIAREALRATTAPVPPVPPTPRVSPTPRTSVTPPTPPTPRARRPVLAPGYSQHQRDECRDQEDDIQAVALNALLQMDEERAVPILTKVLARRDEGSTCLRRKAIFILGQHGSTDTEAILLSTARTDPDAEVRGQAVFWLSQVDSEQAVEALDSILFNSTDPALQDKALFALSQHESVLARRGLRRYVERTDVSDEMKEKALFWLGQSDDPQDAAFLRTMYGQVENAKTKQKILFAAAQSEGPEVGPFLMAILRNTREPMEVRKQALFWLAQRETTGADMASIYGTFSDVEIKEHVIFVLAQGEDKASLDKLVDIAQHEPNQELRKKAIFWLAQTDDPRVADILAELLEKP